MNTRIQTVYSLWFAYLHSFIPDKWSFSAEIIQLEVVRELVFRHKFSYADVDDLQILPFPVRKNNLEGLVLFLHR